MIALNAKSKEAWNNLGVSMHVVRKWSEAIEAFANALALDPNDTEIRHNLRTLLMSTDTSGRVDSEILVKYGESLHKVGRLVDSHRQTLLAIESDPNNAEAWNNLGVTLLQMGLLENAKDALAKAVELNPTDSNSRNNYSKLLVANGCVDEAKNQLNILLEQDPTNETCQSSILELDMVSAEELTDIVASKEIEQAVGSLRKYSKNQLAEHGISLS